jgi:hypothetical protein
LGGWLKRLVETALPDLKDTTLTVEEDKTHDRFQMQVGQAPIGCLVFGDTMSPAQSRLQPEIQTEWPTPLPPPLLTPIKVRIASDLSDDYPVRRVTPTRMSAYAPGWLMGKLVHAALSAWRFPNPQFDLWATAFIQNEGFIDQIQIRHALESVRRRLTRFQGEPLYHRIEQADRRLHEVPYSHTQNGQADRGVIDLLFLEGDRWSVVEFKTDQVADETELRNRLNRSGYLTQLARYQSAGQMLLGQVPQVFLCWLNYRGGILVQASDQIQLSVIAQQ